MKGGFAAWAGALLLGLAAGTGLAAAAGDEFESAVGEVSGSLKEGLRSAKDAVKGTGRGEAPALPRDGLAAGLPAKGPDDPSKCRPETPDEPTLSFADFKWGYTLAEMKEAFDKTYASGRRLKRRAFWNEAKVRYELPFDAERGGPVVLPPRLIAGVVRHVERAFELDYVDAVFFPDMGHSHLLIPEELWKRKYEPYPVNRFSQMYSAMFDDPRLEVFYHTAEQLKTLKEDKKTLVDDPRTRWRHKTRNIAGLNAANADLRVLQNPASEANTVQEVPGYFWWGGGFNISASEKGCFSYTAKGKTYRFDLSLYDLGE